MKVLHYEHQHKESIISLWNKRAPIQGFAELSEKEFSKLITENPYFCPAYTFVAEEAGKLCGFVCGAADNTLPGGEERGYFACLILEEEFEREDNAGLLLTALEESFKRAGKKCSDVLFFNPIHLPWVIPETPGHLHNNAPGIWVESRQYQWFLDRGYAERARECAYYLNLDTFVMPSKQQEKVQALRKEQYEVTIFDKRVHRGLTAMLQELSNPVWEEEILLCSERDIPFLAAVHDNRVVGFAGPIYPEPSGRGYFTGIGVIREQEGKGLGSLLFHRLCEEEKKAGAGYMSLFTGENNPAGKIYEAAGFQPVRRFAIMRKSLN